LGVAGVRFHWRVYAAFAAAAGLLALVSEANNWPALFAGYDTSTPLATFYGQTLAGRAVSILFAAAVAFLAAMAADTFVHLIAPGRRLPGLSIPRAIAVALVLGAASQVGEWLMQQMPGLRTRLPLWELDGMDAWSPAVAIWLRSLAAGFLGVAAAAVYVCGGLALIPPKRWKAALAVIALALALSRTLEIAQLPYTLVLAALICAAAVCIVMTCATDLVSVGAGIFLLSAAAGVWRLWQQPLPQLQWNAAALAVLVILTLSGVNLKVRRTSVQ
jgi:hypothetical protein